MYNYSKFVDHTTPVDTIALFSDVISNIEQYGKPDLTIVITRLKLTGTVAIIILVYNTLDTLSLV